MVYQFNPNMLPDTCFYPGHLKYVVPGNECRLLDPRRTPLRIVEVKLVLGVFVVETLAFEDKGWLWEIPLERVDRCQFAQGSAEASEPDVARYANIISRLDQPLNVPADASTLPTTEATIASLRKAVGDWMERNSQFLSSRPDLDFSQKTGYPVLWEDLRRYMAENNLWDIEDAFSEQYVRSYNFGEVVKGHRIVLAELGLVSFEGKRIRDSGLFEGLWQKQRRADHILHRLAFVQELFERTGHSSVILYRGFSCKGQPRTSVNDSFVSTTFNLEVAMSHFNERHRAATGVLIRQSVPIRRLFMSFLETVQMNKWYKEAEAVLLYDPLNEVF
jgi:hypothetical protein